jgi:hypothetical protein
VWVVEKLVQRSVDKRLRRIERWLKRCMAACKCGSWSSALLEIECMEAETREFRSDVWRAVEEEAGLVKHLPLRCHFFRAFRVSAIALIIVMAVGFPLSLEQDRPFEAFYGDSLALLTSTESDILGALRESLSNLNEGRVLFSVEVPVELPATPEERGAALASAVEHLPTRTGASSVRRTNDTGAPARRPVVVRVEPDPPAQRSASGQGPSVEEVISLIQVGQRALRTSEPAVRVIE